MTKKEILDGALSLNGEDKKYSVTVDGDKIITEIKWMDAVLFQADSVTDEMKSFKFIVTLNDDNTWTELDKTQSSSVKVGLGGISGGYSSFSGKSISFNKTIAIGKKKDEDGIGVVEFEFNSEEYKKIVREYLEKCGYKKKKKGFFATLFGR